jgi:hypothetical protein
VSVFDTNGNFLRRLVSRGPLQAPLGLALAPAPSSDRFGLPPCIGHRAVDELQPMGEQQEFRFGSCRTWRRV